MPLFFLGTSKLQPCHSFSIWWRQYNYCTVTSLQTIDYDGFKLFINTYLESDVPEDLSKHLFLSFIKRPAPEPAPASASATSAASTSKSPSQQHGKDVNTKVGVMFS